jgi:hypothetical protein
MASSGILRDADKFKAVASLDDLRERLTVHRAIVRDQHADGFGSIVAIRARGRRVLSVASQLSLGIGTRS